MSYLIYTEIPPGYIARFINRRRLYCIFINFILHVYSNFPQFLRSLCWNHCWDWHGWSMFVFSSFFFFYSSHALHYDCTSDGFKVSIWRDIQFPDSFTLAFRVTWFIVFMYLNFVSHEMILINVFKRAV